jgi:hypothetical protein
LTQKKLPLPPSDRMALSRAIVIHGEIRVYQCESLPILRWFTADFSSVSLLKSIRPTAPAKRHLKETLTVTIEWRS